MTEVVFKHSLSLCESWSWECCFVVLDVAFLLKAFGELNSSDSVPPPGYLALCFCLSRCSLKHLNAWPLTCILTVIHVQNKHDFQKYCRSIGPCNKNYNTELTMNHLNSKNNFGLDCTRISMMIIILPPDFVCSFIDFRLFFTFRTDTLLFLTWIIDSWLDSFASTICLAECFWTVGM